MRGITAASYAVLGPFTLAAVSGLGLAEMRLPAVVFGVPSLRPTMRSSGETSAGRNVLT